MVAGRGDPQLSPAASDVLAKIMTAVPAGLRPFIAEPSTAAEPPLAAPAAQADMTRMREAIRHWKKMRLVYRSEDGSRMERTIWPLVLGYSDTKSILIAWCETRQAFRHFRADRIEAADLLDQPIPNARSAVMRRWEAWRSAEIALVPPAGHG